MKGGSKLTSITAEYEGMSKTMPDRRESAFNDPRFWVSVTTVLLSLTLFVLTLAVNKLGNIDTAVQSIRDANTRNNTEIESLKRENVDMKSAIKDMQGRLDSESREQTAYNFNMSKDLKEIQVRLQLKGRD